MPGCRAPDHLYRLGASGPHPQKLPSRARRRPSPLPLSARFPALSQHGIPDSSPQSLAEVLRLAFRPLFITCKDAGNILQKGVAGGLENEQKIVGVDFNLPHTPNHIKGKETVTPDPRVALARRKCTIYGAHVLGLV